MTAYFPRTLTVRTRTHVCLEFELCANGRVYPGDSDHLLGGLSAVGRGSVRTQNPGLVISIIHRGSAYSRVFHKLEAAEDP